MICLGKLPRQENDIFIYVKKVNVNVNLFKQSELNNCYLNRLTIFSAYKYYNSLTKPRLTTII